MTLADMYRREGKEEGIMKGMEKGLELGAKQVKLAVVRNAIKEGMQVDVIAKLTGLSKEEIEKIAEETKN